MTRTLLIEIVSTIRYLDWHLRVGGLGDGWYIQWVFPAHDSDTNEATTQHGRKWYVSPHAIADEVVKTAWAALEMALLHEARERFFYHGQPVFHPHTDTQALLLVQQEGHRVHR